jgi:hypothetical protein
MTSQELQKQALQLPISDRWQLVQTLLESLKRESQSSVKRGNLSSLRGIAKSSAGMNELDSKEEYTNYLTKKYQ